MVAAGQLLRASAFNAARGLYVRKPGAESVTSSTVLQNDDALALAVEANKFYELRALLLYDGATAGDFKIGWTYPAGLTIQYGALLPPTSITAASGNTVHNGEFRETDTLGIGAAGAGTTLALPLWGIVTVGVTAGTLQLQWAQFASSATATRVFAGSFLHLKDMGL